MAESITHPSAPPRPRAHLLADIIAWGVLAAFALMVAAFLAFFAIHAWQLLNYHYPLDYGEGPLLAQVEQLRSGTPIWRLYADPSAPPYLVVNYPPVYLLLSALVALPLGDALLAGRLVSLTATIAAVVALWRLASGVQGWPAQRGARLRARLIRAAIVLAFLAVPVVRQWGPFMRVDMLGVCLGLWGLLIVQRHAGRRQVLWAALPLALSLLVKPSLLAAPAAACVWLLFRDWRRALLLGVLMAAGGGLVFALFQVASDGWFALHVLTANANRWVFDLAHDFWFNQIVIIQPLLLAAALSAISQWLVHDERRGRPAGAFGPRITALLPLYYMLFGAIDAFGIGKVGAFLNYFLEFYAGLIWLAASVALPTTDDRPPTTDAEDNSARFSVLGSRFSVLGSLLSVFVILFVMGAALRYFPTWSPTYLQLAGVIEKVNPPRITFGRYGVWQDLQRERAILATFGGINAALNDEVRAAGGPIFTDIAGVATQAGQVGRIQMFEHIQLLEAGRWDQRALLRELANGRTPLVVLDYLGNWMSSEMIAIISHRYAQDGARGSYDLYRPVDPGPRSAIDLGFGNGPQLSGYHLAPPPGRPAYHAGETVLLTLEWQAAPEEAGSAPIEVVTWLAGSPGQTLSQVTQPLLYGALPPADWAGETMQHMQAIRLPLELPAGTYQIVLTLRADGRDLAPPRTLASIAVEEQAGQVLGEQGYFVPTPLLEAWERAGGYAGPGDPLTPAVPFRGYTAQCFVRACLRLEGSAVRRVPLGELVHLADAGLPDASNPAMASQEGVTAQDFPETGQTLYGKFLDYWQANGDAEVFGPPITGELIRGDRIVQYTRYARLERPITEGEVGLGRLGEELLDLPGGQPYRWP